MRAMLTVHHLETSAPARAGCLKNWACPTRSALYARDRTRPLAPPEPKADASTGQSPVVTDDGDTIAESGAILEYLTDKYADQTQRRVGRLAGPSGCTCAGPRSRTGW